MKKTIIYLILITGGLTFGPAWGTLAALTGATLRACGQFGLARLLGRQTIETRRPDFPVAVAADGPCTVLIGHDEQDVQRRVGVAAVSG